MSRQWRILTSLEPASIQDRLDEETALFEAVAQGRAEATASIWAAEQAIVCARSEVRLPNFQMAAIESAADGWPVYVRASGGAAVIQGPGIVNLTLCYRSTEAIDLDASYVDLCRPLQMALGALGIATSRGHVPRSFCDGRFNIIVGQRKIVGTAQKWRPLAGGNGHAVLGHALILLDADLRAGVAQLNRLYLNAGSDAIVDQRSLVNLSELLHRTSPDDLAERFTSALLRQLPHEDSDAKSR